jgi:hypothetical protein
MHRLKPLALKDAMIHASEMGKKEGWPRCYYWSAVWWRLHARESAHPSEPLQWSRNQIALYHDCLRRPEHYKRRRSRELTDWQKMQEA